MTLPPRIVHRGTVGGPSAVPYERLAPGRFPNFSVGMPHPAGSDIEEVGGAQIDGPMAIPGEGPIRPVPSWQYPGQRILEASQ